MMATEISCCGDALRRRSGSPVFSESEMPARSFYQLRCSKDEKESWAACAALSGESVASWLRRLAKEEIELRNAESAEIESAKVDRELVKQAAFPQGDTKCPHTHVAPGAYCYKCDRRK